MNPASRDPVGTLLEACIAAPAMAKTLAAADPSLLHARWAGDPLLHWMVIEDFAAGVTTLLDLGVPVDLRDENGTTALRQAAYLGRLGCARILLERGADPNLLDEHFGENPLNLAVGGHHLGVTILLLEHGARADYLLPGCQCVFHALAHVEPVRRPAFVELLAERGITRDGRFRSLQLADWGYESPEEAFGW